MAQTSPRLTRFPRPAAVYVTGALLYFVKNTEELTGRLCHGDAEALA